MPQHYKSWYEEFLNQPDVEAPRNWIRSDPEFLSSLDQHDDTPLRACIDCGPVSLSGYVLSVVPTPTRRPMAAATPTCFLPSSAMAKMR